MSKILGVTVLVWTSTNPRWLAVCVFVCVCVCVCERERKTPKTGERLQPKPHDLLRNQRDMHTSLSFYVYKLSKY